MYAIRSYYAAREIHPPGTWKIDSSTGKTPPARGRITSYNVCYTKLLREQGTVRTSRRTAGSSVRGSRKAPRSDPSIVQLPWRSPFSRRRPSAGHVCRPSYFFAGSSYSASITSPCCPEAAPSPSGGGDVCAFAAASLYMNSASPWALSYNFV